MYDKLLKLKQEGSARLEYQCRECGYMIYKPVMEEDFPSYIEKWNDYLVLTCPCCSMKTIGLVNILSEEEWISLHKYPEG